MSFDWTEYLRLANGLMESPPFVGEASEEACQRSAISRGYFAVYGRLCEYFRSCQPQGLRLRGRVSDHDNLAKWLDTQEDPHLYTLGEKLGALRGYRNLVDYEATLPASRPDLPNLDLEGVKREWLRDISDALQCMEIAGIL